MGSGNDVDGSGPMTGYRGIKHYNNQTLKDLDPLWGSICENASLIQTTFSKCAQAPEQGDEMVDEFECLSRRDRRRVLRAANLLARVVMRLDGALAR